MLRATVQGVSSMDTRRQRRRASVQVAPSRGDTSHSEAETSEHDSNGTPAAPKLSRSETLALMSPTERFRNRVWVFLDDPSSSTAAQIVSIFILILITLSTITFILETVDFIRDGPGAKVSLRIIEIICISAFTLEFFCRLLACPSLRDFAKDTFNWIDLLAIAPFYLEFLLPNAAGTSSLGVVRAIRLVRVVRVVKVSRYSQSIRVFAAAMASSFRPLSMLFFLVGIAVILFSSAMYYAEFTVDGCRWDGWKDITGEVAGLGQYTCWKDDLGWIQLSNNGTFLFEPTLKQREARAWELGVNVSSIPDEFTVLCACLDPNPFTDIPSTFWWCVVTLTTVGYGDDVPVTGIGKFVAVITMFSGVIILALPITVIGTNFTRVLREIQQQRMSSELDSIDKDGDGMVDLDELRTMINGMVQAAGDLPPELIPDAEALLKRYDADASGQLDQSEVESLKRDIRRIMGLGEQGSAFNTTPKQQPSPRQKVDAKPHLDIIANAATNAAHTKKPFATATATGTTSSPQSSSSSAPIASGTTPVASATTQPEPTSAESESKEPGTKDQTRTDVSHTHAPEDADHSPSGAAKPPTKPLQTGMGTSESSILSESKLRRPSHNGDSGPSGGVGVRFRFSRGENITANRKGSVGSVGGGAGAVGQAERDMELIDTVLRAEERIDRKLVAVATMLEALQQSLVGGGDGVL